MPEYISIYTIYIYIYIDCDNKCEDCKGPNETDCILCNSELSTKYINSTDIICMNCENIKGYYTYINSSIGKPECKEICGDGINLGEFECDDGNREDGDGCSSECVSEKGYLCQHDNPTSPDICKNIMDPELTLNSEYQDKYKFHFDISKPVRILQSGDPKSFMALAMSGQFEKYVFDYEVELKLDLNEHPGSQFYNGIIITYIPLSAIIENDVPYM